MHLNARTSAGIAAALVLASAAAATPAFASVGSKHGTVAHTQATPAAAKADAPVQTVTKSPDKAPEKAAEKAPEKAPAAAKPAEKAPVRTASVSYPNNLDGWIAQARAILAAHGDNVPSAGAIKARALTESSGNPLAENHWDANQALYGGTYGLLQTIKPTFAQYALPGHTDILNPVDSIIAGVRYADARYGSFTTIAYTKAGY
jgi:hypothetical protein